MKDLEDTMKKQFRIQYGKIDEGTGSDNELTLSAFEGVCYECSIKEHMANECSKKKGGSRTGRFRGNSHHCRKKATKK
eukprot:15048301-Ditylum_brightwellii.AAC.1